MQAFTCPSCGRTWSENYCPECARTIDPTAIPQPAHTETGQTATPVSANDKATRSLFRRVFVVATVFQFVVYLLFLLGWDRKSEELFHQFTSAYILFYYPGVLSLWKAFDLLNLPGGLGLLAVGLLVGPLIGIVGYSLLLAFSIALWQRVRKVD